MKINEQLDPKSPFPLHYQIREALRAHAKDGKLADDKGKIPTEMELSERFNVSRITVRKALAQLESEGVLNRIRGRGTFLNANKVEQWSGQLLGFSETIKEAGFIPGAETITYGIEKKLDKNIKKELLLESAWGIKRLRFADKVAIAVEHSYFPIDLGLEFEKQNLDQLLIYDFIEKKLQINLSESKQNISAINADKELSKILDVEIGQALIYAQRVTYSDDGRRIEFLNAYYRPDYFQFIVQLKR